MSKSPWIIDVNETNFEAEVLQRSQTLPVVIDFWAPWCGPCRALGPILEKLADEQQGAFVLAKVNTEDAPQLAAAFQVDSIPLVMAVRNGEVVLHFAGALPEEHVRTFIQRILPNEEEKRLHEAAGLETSDPTAAAATYEATLKTDPRNETALLGLARLALARGDDSAAADFLGRADFVGDNEPEAERLRATLDLRQQAQSFGEEAALRGKLDADPKNARLGYELGCVLAAAGKYRDALETLLQAGEADRKLAAKEVRETMVKIFHAVGVRSELADEFRRRLTQLLY